MRKVSFGLAVAFVLSACGGGEEAAPPPKAPETVAPAPAPAPTTQASAKPEEPKLSPAEAMKKTMAAIPEAMNAHDAKKLAGFYAENAVVKQAGAPDVTGRDAIQANYQRLFDAFSNFKTGARRVFVKNDVMVVEWTFTGTHSGDLWGVKATEKPVGAEGADIYWFTPEGLVKEHHIYFDGATMMSQIGVSKQKARAVPTLPSSPEVVVATADDQKNLDATKAMSSAIENKKEADFLAPVADTLEYDDMTQPQTMKGKNDAKKFFKEITTGFPDSKFTPLNAWSVGDYVITETEWKGTHKGSFFGIPATKKAVDTRSLAVYRFKDGKLVKGTSYANGADLAMQLGLIKPPAAKKDDKAAAAPAKKDDKAAAPAKKDDKK